MWDGRSGMGPVQDNQHDQQNQRALLISAGGTPDALKEVIGLLRAGWCVVESRPADQIIWSRAAAKTPGEGPYSLVILERVPPAAD